MIRTVVFDTKPYDRGQLQCASVGRGIEWRFMDCRPTGLNADQDVAEMRGLRSLAAPK